MIEPEEQCRAEGNVSERTMKKMRIYMEYLKKAKQSKHNASEMTGTEAAADSVTTTENGVITTSKTMATTTI